MTQRDKNSFGLIVLVLAMLAFFALAFPAFRFSLPRIFMHDWLGMSMGGGPIHIINSGTGIARLMPLAALYLIWACVALWVYRDAEKRDLNGLLWGLFVLIGNVIGLIIYLILRGTSPQVEPTGHRIAPAGNAASASADDPELPCPGCAKPVRASFVACPYCARPLKTACTSCGRDLETDWKACPYCGQHVDEG